MSDLDSAVRFNKLCPKGSAVEITLKSGELLRAKTVGPAFLWGGMALVELQGRTGPFQVEFVRPIGDAPQG